MQNDENKKNSVHMLRKHMSYAKNYVVFDSAGWHNAFDYAQPETIDYVKSKGIEINDFQPKAITRELIEKRDLIIGMERYHLIKVKKRFTRTIKTEALYFERI